MKIKDIFELRQLLEKDDTLKNISDTKLELIAHCCGEGYDDLSYYKFFTRDSAVGVLMRNLEDGHYEFFAEVGRNEEYKIPLKLSEDAEEIRQHIFEDDTLDLCPNTSRIKCLGRCSDYFRIWMFQYKDAYVLLKDIGNGHYYFWKEVNPTDIAIDDD